MDRGKHDHTCTVRLTDQEYHLIMEKVKESGFPQISTYMRQMAINGYILKLELPELKEMISLMRYSSNNLNQIARKVNGTGTVAESELREIKALHESIWEGINRILRKLGEIP